MKYIQDFSFCAGSFSFNFINKGNLVEGHPSQVSYSIEVYIDNQFVRCIPLDQFLEDLSIPTEVLLEIIAKNKIKQLNKEQQSLDSEKK